MKFDTSILREADIRGIYPDQIDGLFANRLGKVFGSYLRKIGITSCVVGHDNRFGGPNLTKTLIEGLISTGVDVNYIGLVTTPMLNYASHKLEIEYGIMVTASHNPKEDNGFKLFGKDYLHCSHDELKIIYDGLQDENYYIYEGKGQINHINISESYAKEIASSISVGDHHLRVVVDCGNGTASSIIRNVYDRLPFDVTYLFCDSNPSFPNHHPDPNVKDNLSKLAKAVKHNRADIGLAYDGDCDRCGFVDNKGNIIDADIMMAIMCRAIIKNSDNKKILMDIKSSNALKDAIEGAGGEVFLDTASSAQEERSIFENNIPFGGSYSNHIFFHDRHPGYDDGIYTGLRVQEMLSFSDKSLNEICKGIKKYYNTEEIKIKTTDDRKFKIIDGIKQYCDTQSYSYMELDGLKVFKEEGWALLRASNTGPNLTLRFEATSEKELKDIKKDFMDVLGILLK